MLYFTGKWSQQNEKMKNEKKYTRKRKLKLYILY